MSRPFSTFVCAALASVVTFSSAGDAQAGEIGQKKAGPLMGNIKLAPATDLGLTDYGFYYNCGGRYWGCGSRRTQFAAQFEIAYAIDGEDAYLGFNPQFQVNDLFALINLTGTFQYDIAIKKVTGLNIYPKISAGLGIIPNNNFGFCSDCRRDGTDVMGTIQPEVGVKYNLFKKFHVLGEPLSFPLYFGEAFGAQYRFWLGCGFDL